jgi:sensor histidine kinase YesM
MNNTANLAAVDKKNPLALNNIGWFLLINLGLNLLITVFLCPSCYTSLSLFVGYLDDFSYSFILTCFLSGGISQIVKKSDNHFPWLDAPLSRLVFDILVVSSYTFVISFCLATIFSIFVWDYFTLEQVGWGSIAEATVTPIIIALGITLFLTSRSFLLEWRQAAIEAEQMRSERLQGQYQSLKEQLNPHFLFNSLNVLSNLVYENADQANAFIEKLSKIYRYVLDVQHEELVSLEREAAFAENYLELQKLRFGPKFSHRLSLEQMKEYSLPPLTLQMLLENVFKHNVATKAKPLDLSIRQEGDSLVVMNTLQKRDSGMAKNGIGLNNIKERYRFLTDKEVEVEATEGLFRVRVPLIKNLKTQ